MNLTIGEILKLPDFNAKNIGSLENKKVKGISTNSRSVRPGDVFIALRGEKFNGHDFIADAFKRGATCAMVDCKWMPSIHEPLITVEDTTKAFGMIARLYRRKYSIPVIAVAGSNGKTTTKELIAAVLRRRYRVLRTKWNLNNQFGVPQTLLQLKPSHQLAVIEIGTNHFGELKYLCDILEPTHGIVTNIGREHLEFFCDLAGVAKEEGQLFKYLGSTGTAFVYADDEQVLARSKCARRKIRYGFINKRAAIRGKMLGADMQGCYSFSVNIKGKKPFTVKLAIPGNHAALNALAAVAVGHAFNIPANEIKYALEKFSGLNKRMEVFTECGVKVLNDTYNANPDSMIAALQTLQLMKVSGKKIVVFADMLELGDCSEQEHRRIGNAVGEMGFEYLLTYGSDAKYIYEEAAIRHKYYYAKQEEISKNLCAMISSGDAVLVKGSRGLKMENVVGDLRNYLKTLRISKSKQISSRVN